jgi:acyl-CoA synthetase (AMP-forming)/AMP-acid ligase II
VGAAVPVLFVALNSDATLTVDQISEHARENLSKYKLPVEITVLDTLPKNPVGKLDKPSLRKSRTEAGRTA